MPRWVKVFAVIGVAILLLLGISLLKDDGGHGPGRHLRSEATSAHVLAHAPGPGAG